MGRKRPGTGVEPLKSCIRVRFRWNGRVYRVARVSSSWESRDGVYRNLHYMVNTMSGDAYEIHLDTSSMSWRLDYGYGAT